MSQTSGAVAVLNNSAGEITFVTLCNTSASSLFEVDARPNLGYSEKCLGDI